VVDPKYQKRGIGKMLIDVTVNKANELGFRNLYLFTFDLAITDYYQSFGWKKIGVGEVESHTVTIMEMSTM